MRWKIIWGEKFHSPQWHSAGVQFPRIDNFVVVATGIVTVLFCGVADDERVVGTADDEKAAIGDEETGGIAGDDVETRGAADNEDVEAGEEISAVCAGHLGFRRRGQQHLPSAWLSTKTKKIIKKQAPIINIFLNIILSPYTYYLIA